MTQSFRPEHSGVEEFSGEIFTVASRDWSTSLGMTSV